MTDQSNTQAQSVQKKAHATIHEHRIAQAEDVQHTLYLDIKRNWKPVNDNPIYNPRVFFMKDGRIGMEYGGRVIVRSIELWMAQEQG